MLTRLVYALIALVWLATMGLVVKKEIIDRRAPGPQAGYASVLTPERRDYQSRMGIFFRRQRLGTSTIFFHYEPDGGYSISNDVTLTMPAVPPFLWKETQAVIQSSISVGRDYRPQSLFLIFDSPLYRGRINGSARGDTMLLRTEIGGVVEEREIPLPKSEVFSAGLLPLLPVGKMKVGDRWSVVSFNPLSLKESVATAEVARRDLIYWRDRRTVAYLVNVTQSGLTLKAWVNARGEVLRATTLFNITLEKEDIPLDDETVTSQR